MQKIYCSAAALFFGVAAGLAPNSGVAQERLPAVSGLNGKIDLGGGVVAGDGSGVLSGAISLPLGQQFGVQVDGLVGTTDGETTGGVGGHVFWRDPDTALLGVYGQYFNSSSVDDRDHITVGAEAELYLDRITLSGFAGFEQIDDSFDDQGEVAATATAAFYATDDLRLELDYAHLNELDGFGGGLEWQPGLEAAPGVSLYAGGLYREDEEFSALAGVRIYFGEDKTLIRRHREDDPATPLSTAFKMMGQEPEAPAPPPSEELLIKLD